MIFTHVLSRAAIALTVVVSGLAATAPAFADVSDLDRKICADRNEDADKKIAACTVVLGYPSERALHANAYHQRGLSFFRKQKLDFAIADYTEAIKLDRNSFLPMARGLWPTTRRAIPIAPCRMRAKV